MRSRHLSIFVLALGAFCTADARAVTQYCPVSEYGVMSNVYWYYSKRCDDGSCAPSIVGDTRSHTTGGTCMPDCSGCSDVINGSFLKEVATNRGPAPERHPQTAHVLSNELKRSGVKSLAHHSDFLVDADRKPIPGVRYYVAKYTDRDHAKDRWFRLFSYEKSIFVEGEKVVPLHGGQEMEPDPHYPAVLAVGAPQKEPDGHYCFLTLTIDGTPTTFLVLLKGPDQVHGK